MNEAGTVFRDIVKSPDLFRECVDYTARQTGFRRELVEKDFYASALLCHLSELLPITVVFKGGTCLSKIYADFYRLSEDLDFTLPLSPDAPRTERRRLIKPVKAACEKLALILPELHELEPLRGANESTQYFGTWGYRSVVTGATERVKIEFGLREPELRPAEDREANTLLQNVVTGIRLISPFNVHVMSLSEVWAEKVRAALTRMQPAIRDFFDLDYALLNVQLRLADTDFQELVRRKLAVPGNGPVNLSAARRVELDRQVEGQLRTVLRPQDFDRFDLPRIWDALVALATHLALIGGTC
jgi:predicted nucleotidyltransferase component of viral defense system